MSTNRVIVCLCLCLAFWSAVDAFTQSTGDFVADEFVSVSSVSLRATGKRSEFGEQLFSLNLNIFGTNRNILLEVKPVEDDMVSPNCTWNSVHGTTVLESHPCIRPEAYEGVGESKYGIFLSFLDSNRTVLKGFFTLEGERYFIDPIFEHATTLKIMDKLSLVKGPMIVYRENETQPPKVDLPWNSTLADGQKKRALRQVLPESTTVAYPSQPFGSGQCTIKKTIKIKWHLDHSFVNRWNAEFAATKNAFLDPFPTSGTDWQGWSTRSQWAGVMVNAISKFIYERSVGIRMILDAVDEHATPGDADWNQRGTSSGGRYSCPYDINTMLDQYTEWCNGDGASRCLSGSSGGLNHMMSDCQRLYPGQSGTVGLAWVGVICSTSNTGTCTFLGGRSSYQCSAHEMGHNFGAPHDFRTGNQDIMSYASKQYDGFSDQTYGKICSHLATRGYKCLADTGSSTPTCKPTCSNSAQCGSDGCGGQCGTCKIGQTCSGTTCVTQCTPKCSGKKCGDDGCGGSCGTCASGFGCSTAGLCVSLTPTCTPNCVNKGCGVSDGCNGICGKGCDVSQYALGYTCSASTGFKCVAPAQPPTCKPNCNGKLCGSDGCGGSCGSCGTGAVCSTTTFQCVCSPITSCTAQKKTCGTLFDGCKTVTCGPACTTPCTPNPNACAGKTCGYVSNGCATIECGKCTNTPTISRTCISNQCVVSNVCGTCSANADCTNGGTKCVCRAGFVGDGVNCQLADPITPPTQAISWVADIGSANDWSMSDEGNMLSNDNPSTDATKPSLLRWKDSKQLLQGSTSITVTVMLRLDSLQSVGGLAFITSTKGYAAIAVTGTRVTARYGAAGDQGRTLVLGNIPKFDSSKWNNVTLVITRPDTSSTILQTYVNDQGFPANCQGTCKGYATKDLFGAYPDLTNGDIGFFNLGDVSDFSYLRVASKTQVIITLGACFTNNDLVDNLSDLMNVDPGLISDLDNSCSGSGGKRSVEEAGSVVSFTVSGATEFSSSAVGPSIMVAELESGGVLASSAGAPLGISSVVTIPAAAAAAAAAPAAAASSGLSAGAIAGIVIGAVAGAALIAGGAYVAVKKLSSDSSESSSQPQEKSMVLFQDAPKNDGPPKPKGGIDVITNTSHSHHQSITARSVPITK